VLLGKWEEAQGKWEKAARGDKDQRAYPWGDRFLAIRCNCRELGLWGTTPVGVFPDGVSPYGCLDMSGNVDGWTRSLDGDYPYPDDAEGRRHREDLQASGRRVLRGGAFNNLDYFLRCAYHFHFVPDYCDFNFGFRVVLSPFL
jgi:formylglycine-generating enzyme required for sulfatase activity